MIPFNSVMGLREIVIVLTSSFGIGLTIMFLDHYKVISFPIDTSKLMVVGMIYGFTYQLITWILVNFF